MQTKTPRATRRYQKYKHRCSYLEAAGPLVIFDQAVFVQNVGCCVHQIHPASLQQRVCGAVVMGDSIQSGVAEHAYVQVGVAQPVHSVLTHKGMRNY